MSGHTPGTWRNVDGRILPDNYLLEGAPIATVHSRKRDGMQAANAHLIAAAPELLAALRFLVGWVPGGESAWFTDGAKDAVDKARAAIAKATTPDDRGATA